MRGNLLVSEPERSENRRRNDGTCNGWNPAFCGERLDDGGEGTGRLFLLGVAGGFCLAPIKQGISLGSNNGNTYNHGYSEHGKTSGRKKSNARSKRRMKSAVQGPVYPAPCGGDKDLQ